MDSNRIVGGLWCTDVLAGLSDYLDGELPPATVAKVEEHLRGCPNCNVFGTDMAALVTALAALPSELPSDVAARLEKAISSLA